MLKFNNKTIPDFVRVKRVDIQALPEVSHFTRKIAGSNGMLMGRTTLGAKIIKAPFIIVPPVGKTLQECSRDLGKWLIGDRWKLSPLIITDEEKVMYMAKINNSVNVTDLLVAGEGELEFIVPSGVSESLYSLEEKGTQTVKFSYWGSAVSHPEIELTFTADVPLSTITVTDTTTGALSSFRGAFKKDDKVLIDSKNSCIKLNNVLSMRLLTLEHRFITLEGEPHEIKCSIPQCNILVKYKFCWT